MGGGEAGFASVCIGASVPAVSGDIFDDQECGVDIASESRLCTERKLSADR